jgi:WD40 repeat protein
MPIPGSPYPQLAHTNTITALAFTPDGHILVSGSKDSTVKLWDVESGRLLRTLYAEEGGHVLALSISPDGKHIAAGYGPGDGSWFSIEGTRYCPSAILLWDIQTGILLKTFNKNRNGHRYGVNALAFSPDGSRLLSVSHYLDKNDIILWSLKTGRTLKSFTALSSRYRFVSFTPDGKNFIVAGKHNDIALIDIETGNKIRSWKDNDKKSILVNSGALSPDGKQLVLCGDSGHCLMSWDTETGKEVWIEMPDGIDVVTFTPDGKSLLCGSKKHIYIINADDGKTVPFFTGHFANIAAIAISADGKYAATGSDNSADAYHSIELKIWDVNSAREVHSLFTPVDYNQPVICAPDGKRLLMRASLSILTVWDTLAGKEIRSFTGDSNAIRCAALSPDGKLIVSAAADTNNLKLRDVETGIELKQFSAPSYGIAGLYFISDGKYILALGESRSVVYDTRTGEILRTFFKSFSWRAPVYSGSNDCLFAFVTGESRNEIIYILNVETGDEICKLNMPEDRDYRCPFVVVYAAGAIRIACFFDPAISTNYNNKMLKVYDSSAGKEIFTITDDKEEINEGTLAFSPDGQCLAFGIGTSIRIYHIESGILKNTLSGHKSAIETLSYSPNGGKFISKSEDGIIIWDAESGRHIQTIIAGTVLDDSLPMDSTGSRLLTSSMTVMQTWDIQTGKPVGTFPINGCPEEAAFCPDGNRFLSHNNKVIQSQDALTGRVLSSMLTNSYYSGFDFRASTTHFIKTETGERKIGVWDYKTGRQILSLAEEAYRAVYSHNGKRIACGYSCHYLGHNLNDGAIKLFDADTGTELKKIDTHSESILSLAFSPDDTSLASGSDHHVITLWDVERGTPIRKFTGHKGNITSIAFIPNGKLLVSHSKDLTMRIWDVETARCLKIIQGIDTIARESAASSAWRFIAAQTVHGTTKLFNKETGEEIVHILNFKDAEWLCITRDGYYIASPNGEKYLNVYTAEGVTCIDSGQALYNRPEIVMARLQRK